jgi:uncharacterized protein YdeI (BOF family)
MNTVFKRILCLGSLAVLPFSLFAGWSSDDIRTIDSVKQWKMDDRVVHVKGTINRLDENKGFYLSDDTGEIRVALDNHELRDHHFKTGSHVEVKGRVDREHKHTDLKATAVKLSDGTIIGSL